MISKHSWERRKLSPSKPCDQLNPQGKQGSRPGGRKERQGTTGNGRWTHYNREKQKPRRG